MFREKSRHFQKCIFLVCFLASSSPAKITKPYKIISKYFNKKAPKGYFGAKRLVTAAFLALIKPNYEQDTDGLFAVIQANQGRTTQLVKQISTEVGGGIIKA